MSIGALKRRLSRIEHMPAMAPPILVTVRRLTPFPAGRPQREPRDPSTDAPPPPQRQGVAPMVVRFVYCPIT